MARGSHSSSFGIAHPALIGAVALLVMATFFGDDVALWPSAKATALEQWSGTDAMLAPAPPEQRAIEAPPRPLMAAGFVAEPSHFFTVDALVLSHKTYRHDDEAEISPLDLMLGWGPMSNPALLAQIRVRQSGRFGYVRASHNAPLDLDALSPYWTNVHVLPASPDIAERLAEIRTGDLVRLEGALVNVAGPRGWHWRTSTSRTDRGAGACEVLLVTSVERRS
ncbi:MAG: hypothetical protein AAGB05_08890 [Pseudomonadota bacterium]